MSSYQCKQYFLPFLLLHGATFILLLLSVEHNNSRSKPRTHLCTAVLYSVRFLKTFNLP